MANPKGNQYNINLGSSAENIDLTLDKYKGEIIPYQGFIKKNSPFISNELKNVYTKSENRQTVVDYNSNTYYVENNKLYKNGEETGMEFTNGGFVSIEKSNEYTEESLRKMEVEPFFDEHTQNMKIRVKSLAIQELGYADDYYDITINDTISSLLDGNINNLEIFENYDYKEIYIYEQLSYTVFQINAYIRNIQRFACFSLCVFKYNPLSPMRVVNQKLDRFILLNAINENNLLCISTNTFVYYNLNFFSYSDESIITNDEDSNDNIIYSVYNSHDVSGIPYLFTTYVCSANPFRLYLGDMLYYKHIDINSIFKFTNNYIYLKAIPPLLYLTNIYSYILSVPIIINYRVHDNKIFFDRTKLVINSTENSGVTYYELCSNPYYYTRILDDNSIEYLEYLCRETQMINFGIDGSNFNRSYLIKILFALGKWNYRTNYSDGIYNIDAIDYLITTGSPAHTARDYNIATINSNGRYKRFCSNAIKDFKILQDTNENFVMKLPVCMYAVKYTDSINYDTDVDYSDIIDKRTLPLKSFFVLDGYINNDNVLYFYGDTKIVTSQNSANDFGHIRLLYIQDIISGVSVYENASDDGNIVTQWLNIDDAKYIGNDQCIIK